MNLKEILVESEPLTERPVGMLKGLGQNIAAKVLPGSLGAKAAGARDAGKVANQLYKEFFTFIGRTGDKPTNVSLAAFLKSLGVNDTIINKYTSGSQPAQDTATNTAQSTASQSQDKPKRVRDYKAEKAKTAANKAAKAAAQQQAPAAPQAAAPATAPRKGFNVNVAQTKAQKNTAATAAAGSNAIRYRVPESRIVENVLRKVGTRL